MRYLIVATTSSLKLARAERVFAQQARGPWRFAEHTAESGGVIRVYHESPDSKHVPPRVPLHETESHLVLYDGFPLHPEFDAFDARTLMSTERWDQLIGRYAVIRFTKSSGELEVVIDPIGGCQCYHADMGEGWLLTNSPLIAHMLADRGDLDEYGASGLLCAPAPLGQHTLVSTVRLLPQGSRSVAGIDRAPSSHAKDPLIAAGRSLFDMTPDQAASSFASVFGPIFHRLDEAGFDFRCALTGGRDSRALAALYATSTNEPSFHFGGAQGAAESVIAEQAATKLGGSFELKSDPNNPNAENYDDCEQSIFDRYCGMIDFTYLRPPPGTSPDPNEHREVHITGQAGEIARWSFESLSGMLRTPTVKTSSVRLRTRLIKKGDGLFTSRASSTAINNVQSLIDQALSAGVTHGNLQTVVANQLKAPRWAALQLTRSAERRDIIAPFLTPTFFDVAMRIHPKHRFADAFHRALITQCAPEVLDVPFHSYLTTRQRLRNELARNIIGAVPHLKPVYAKRKGPGRHARWEPWLRPILRDRMLDHDKSSPVWGLIDRPTLERTLCDETGEGFKLNVYPLLNAATLVRFWDWYGRLPSD
ncbi:MAG: hypothetical protein KDA29_08990 [Phycisphaerales bacterium]|nr:hypothetical protein [Phycisphaerales bacterium]